MPAEITQDPLGIECVFSDGTSARFDLGGLPCPALARDLLAGLAELIHPHGTVDSAASVGHYAQFIRHMTRHLAASGFAGGAADLRRAQVARYWLAASGPREACTRRMLQGFQAAGGVLDAGLAELAAGRAYNPQRSHRQLPPYSETEWERLASTCQAVTGESFAAHKRALAAAGRGQHPREHGWSEENLRWLLARTGPVGIVAFGEHLGCSDNVVRQRGGVLEASRELFPGLDVVIAYRLLFGIYSGIVPDGIDDLATGDIDWAGDSTILLSYVKGRTAAESLNLPRQAVRLLEQWLAHSALLRSHAGPGQRRDLWLRLSKPGGTGISAKAGQAGRVAIQRWVTRHGVTGDDGSPLKIHRSRIRTTHQSMRDTRAWAGRGRATIDPNHSPEVEGDHYLTATTPSQRQAAEAIVEDAQHDLLRRARPPVVVSGADAAALARGYPQLVASLGLGGTVIAELAGGQRDVFTAACADQLSGLHGPAGKPCPARPWVCLLCPLAVFAPRHAANLLRLKAFFSRQWQQMPAAQFMAVFGPYSQRVSQVLDRLDPAVVTRAAASVGDRDDEIPLRPEEFTR
jgi:hypothetical protein